MGDDGFDEPRAPNTSLAPAGTGAVGACSRAFGATSGVMAMPSGPLDPAPALQQLPTAWLLPLYKNLTASFVTYLDAFHGREMRTEK